MHVHRIALLLCCTLLMACGGDKAGAEGAAGEDGLPKPATASGSVTGMPDPGVASTRRAASATQAKDDVELPASLEDGEMEPMDPDTQTMPIEGAPAMPPESAMPEDPNAPPPSPAEEAAATTDPNVPRQ